MIMNHGNENYKLNETSSGMPKNAFIKMQQYSFMHSLKIYKEIQKVSCLAYKRKRKLFIHLKKLHTCIQANSDNTAQVNA